jgi:hypothetical protein
LVKKLDNFWENTVFPARIGARKFKETLLKVCESCIDAAGRALVKFFEEMR